MENQKKETKTTETCRKPHADKNPNCTGVCQKLKDHTGDHKDQHGHTWS